MRPIYQLDYTAFKHINNLLEPGMQNYKAKSWLKVTKM